jgi:hypothetical protein
VEAQFALVVVEGGVELVRPMAPAAIHDHHDLLLSFLEGRHHLVQILTQLLGIKVRHDFIEDFGGPLVDGADDAEQHTAGDAAPRTILQPRLTFEAFCAFDVALAQGARVEARAALCATSPRGGGQSARGSFRLHRAQ